jgi:hypothetical protein
LSRGCLLRPTQAYGPFERAISLDPTFAAAYAALGWTYWLDWVFQWDVNPRTEVAAFSGTWEGRWEGDVPSRLVVERIDAEWARVVYAWGDDPGGRFKGDWERVPAKVLPGGRLQSVDDALKTTLTFEMAQDRMNIQGQHDAAARGTKVRMQRIGPLP